VKPLHLAEGLDLNAEDLLESAVGIIAKRGRGKSGAVKVLMEELTSVGLPFVALDPVGILWGIRSSFDGTGPGLPVLVIGGEHGDVALERKAGATVADRIIKENISCVIDFSEEPKAAYREFVRDFAHELFRKNDTPRMVILEEAPELVPQKVQGDRAETFEAVERLVSRGRNKGLGVVLVSQRAATINKDVLTQIDVLIVLGLAAPQDRKALGDWIRAWDQEGQADVFDKGLAGLHRQEAWVWSPEAFGGLFQRVKFRDFTTFHPDKTHLRRMGWLKVRPVTADVAGAVARFKGEKRRSKEENVDEKERKEYDARLHRLEETVESLKAERDSWVEKYNKEHDRAEANARAAAANAVHRVESPDPFHQAFHTTSGCDQCAPGHQMSKGHPGDHTVDEGESRPAAEGGASERERIDLHAQRLEANLTVHEKLVHVDALEEGESVNRFALLVAEGFFDTKRTNSHVRDEMRRRGWGQWIGGGANDQMNDLLQKFCEWRIIDRVEGNKRVDYEVVPAAKERIRVVKETVAA